jgi:hypothetical protein
MMMLMITNKQTHRYRDSKNRKMKEEMAGKI